MACGAATKPNPPDFSKMDPARIIDVCRDNADAWATAFCQYAAKLGHTLDQAWVMGWFANAIEGSHDLRKRKEKR